MKTEAVLNNMYANAPLVFGHRGAQAYAPPNTLPAFQLAVEQGAHGSELDVHRSKDGHPVVIHDFSVDATTDGSGHVADLTLAELKALDAGGWYAPGYAGVTIPTLDEVFEAVGKHLFINIEIKSNTQETDGVEQVVAECIRRHAMEERVIVSAFNPLALRRFRDLMPDVPIGFLYAKDSPDSAHALIADFAVEALHPEDILINPLLVEKAHNAGQRVNAWTVNDVEQARQLVEMGVDCIITDAPDRILAALV